MKWKVGAYLRTSSDLHMCTGAHIYTAFIHKCMHVCAIHMYIYITQRWNILIIQLVRFIIENILSNSLLSFAFYWRIYLRVTNRFLTFKLWPTGNPERHIDGVYRLGTVTSNQSTWACTSASCFTHKCSKGLRILQKISWKHIFTVFSSTEWGKQFTSLFLVLPHFFPRISQKCSFPQEMCCFR